MKTWYYTFLACLLLSGCNFTPSAAPAATINPVPTAGESAATAEPLKPVPTAQVEQQLQGLWDRLDKGSSPANKPSIAWQPAYSALFPSEWPPTPNTTWVRYAYAQGMDIDLPDGVRVSAPWARLELRGKADAVTIVPLNAKLEPVTTQGFQPLDEAAHAVLDKEAAVSAYCLQLTVLPQPNSPQTAEVRTFYRTWLEYNGAMVDLIRPNHAGFLAWVNE